MHAGWLTTCCGCHGQDGAIAQDMAGHQALVRIAELNGELGQLAKAMALNVEWQDAAMVQETNRLEDVDKDCKVCRPCICLYGSVADLLHKKRFSAACMLFILFRDF